MGGSFSHGVPSPAVLCGPVAYLPLVLYANDPAVAAWAAAAWPRMQERDGLRSRVGGLGDCPMRWWPSLAGGASLAREAAVSAVGTRSRM